MSRTIIVRLIAVGVSAIAFAGCGHGSSSASQPAHTALADATPAAQTPLASNAQAFEAAATHCEKTTPLYTTALSSACAEVAGAAVAIRLQYAAGTDALDATAMSMRAHHAPGAELPATNAAGLTPPDTMPADDARYIGGVSIGPIPGEITVTWAHGVLAGKKLVATPDTSTAQNLCWRIDATATTVPVAAQRIGPPLQVGCN